MLPLNSQGVSAIPAKHESPRFSWIDRMAQSLMFRRLGVMSGGVLTIDDGSTRHKFGESGALNCELQVHDAGFFRAAVLGGKISVAQTYIDGLWDCDHLTTLFRIFIRNMESSDGMDRGLAKVAGWFQRLGHALRDNTPGGSRRNIQAHYDLGNEFFQLWLDPTMAYSAGIFRDWSDELVSASHEKFDRVCRKLNVGPDTRLLEIGTGWGGMALHAAREHGCQVTTTTISPAQHAEARRLIASNGMADRVEVLLKDYRDLHGRFDRLCSIEMVEAVGHRHLPQFFRKSSDLLTDDGSMVLQAIIMPESRHARYLNNVDFIQRYVFPGGCLPSVASLTNAAGAAGDLRLVHYEDFAPHYAETLRRWRTKFENRLDDVRALGYPETFIRLWRYYLSYCEAAFEERYIGVAHLQFDKPGCRRDPLELTQWAATHRESPHRSLHSSQKGNIS